MYTPTHQKHMSHTDIHDAWSVYASNARFQEADSIMADMRKKTMWVVLQGAGVLYGLRGNVSRRTYGIAAACVLASHSAGCLWILRKDHTRGQRVRDIGNMYIKGSVPGFELREDDLNVPRWLDEINTVAPNQFLYKKAKEALRDKAYTTYLSIVSGWEVDSHPGVW